MGKGFSCISTLRSVLLNSLQTALFKISKDNTRFELEAAVQVHFTTKVLFQAKVFRQKDNNYDLNRSPVIMIKI